MIWSIRLALVFYLIRLLVFPPFSRKPRIPEFAECILWSSGCLCYLVHVYAAFDQAHDWSHQSAWEHTADETARMTGWARGEGIWINYLFTLVWAADVIRILRAYRTRRVTHPKVDAVIQASFAFIVFNATVVFGPPFYRVAAVPVVIVLLWRIRGNRSQVWPAQ